MATTQFTSRALFVPPRMAEEQKTYWDPRGYSQSDVASSLGSFGLSGGGGFGRLGLISAQPAPDSGVADLNSVLAQVHNGFTDFIDTLTGTKAQQQAQQNALALAQIQAQQSYANEQVSSAGWVQATPWLAIGGAVVVVAIVMSAARK